MFQFILGKSGSGKTTAAIEILTKLRQNGEKKLLMLVPDQSSFETETAFLHFLGPKLCRDVLVFGFSRMCDYVFRQTGSEPENVINDGVRKIVMSKALKGVEDRLTVFKSGKSRKSVLDIMLHSLKECKKNNVTSDRLTQAAGQIENETLRRKMLESALVIDAYNAIIKDTYIDPSDRLSILADALCESDIFDGYTIAVDSFSGFTKQQYDVIELLMGKSKDFYVTLNLDMNYSQEDLFHTTFETYNELLSLAANQSIEVGESVILDKFRRSDKEDISFLEENCLRINNGIYKNHAENIETFSALNIYREVEFVARSIRKLVCEQGLRYSDIAVICRSIEDYNGILDVALEKYDIPYFMDLPRDVFTAPVVRFISSAIECVLSGYERESLLSMLKTGLTSLNETELSDFENYLFIWNLNRSDLKKPFKDNPSGFEKLKDSDSQKLEELEAIRKSVVSPLFKFRENTKDKTGREISLALYELLDDYNIADSIDRIYDKLESMGMISEANEVVRVYNLVIEQLDSLVAAVGDDNLTLKKYKEYLDFILADIKFSDIPRYQDQVSIATADRARLDNEKVVFIIGLVDGKFPNDPKTVGAFTENEKRIMLEYLIRFTDFTDDLTKHEKYLAYCALTGARERVVLTTYVSDFEGNDYKPSEIFTDAVYLFPNRVHSTSADFNELKSLYTEQQAFEYLARHFTSKEPEIKALREYFENSGHYSPLLEKLDAVVNKKPFAINNREIAEKLFRKNMKVSASQLETYGKCAFRYFCNYGLRAKERRAASIDGLEFGNIVHYFLEIFLRMHDKETLNSLSQEQISADIEQITAKYAEETFGGLADKSKAFLVLLDRIKLNLIALINQLIRQLSYSDFVPVDFELKIGEDIPAYKLNIDDESTISVIGSVDRVDTLKKNDDETYVRIVDYKTGPKNFSLDEVLSGINMQMLIYLRSVAENGEEYYKSKLIPSGVLYMPSTAGDIAVDDETTEKTIQNERDKGFKMNGIILGEQEVRDSMDKLGKFIKYDKKIDGEYSNSVADTEQFNLIFKHIDETITSMGKELLSGNIEAKPLKGIVNGCEYCPYDSVCLHTYEDDYKYRKPMNAKEVYDELKGKGEDNNG